MQTITSREMDRLIEERGQREEEDCDEYKQNLPYITKEQRATLIKSYYGQRCRNKEEK